MDAGSRSWRSVIPIRPWWNWTSPSPSNGITPWPTASGHGLTRRGPVRTGQQRRHRGHPARSVVPPRPLQSGRSLPGQRRLRAGLCRSARGGFAGPRLDRQGRRDAGRAYRDRGLKRLKKEQWAPALDDLLASAGHEPTLEKQLHPQIAEAYRGRGLDYARAGEAEKALSDLNEAVRLDGRNAKNYEARGQTYYKWAKWDLALADLTKAASLDPEIEYQLRGRIDEARRMLKESGG